MTKRILSLILTVCLVIGLLVPFGSVQAASDSVDYSIIDARNLKGGDIGDIEKGDFISWTKQQYESGKLNWYILDHNNNRPNGDTRISSTYGMRVGGNVDTWIAFVIEAPGSGTYTMQMTCSEYSYGAELALAYIMPMSDSVTRDTIHATIEKGAALGSADFYSASASGYNNKTATLGSYTFTAGQEYVFILHASEGYGVTGDAAYMLFSKITAVKGSVSSGDEMEINAVNLGAMITEFGMQGQIGLREVNGYDYYFLPIKGGSMHIYNLDYYCDGDSETDPYVGSVSTGINCAWGCSAGEDGKIYVTGDAKHVYRYDPDTGKGEKLTFSQSYVCGYDVGADAAGNIYIGLNKTNAGVAYYEKATGTFHIYDGLDTTGIADDCSAVAWDSQYIYAYLCGQVGDSKTRIIVQVNKATGEVVNQKDVSDKVGSTGHLTGMNVVDGVLFAGSNGVQNMIAIDIATWSFINIGVSGGIKGNVSEEKDGKVYFICSDKYAYSYDIATRQATRLKITTSQCLHTNVNSFVTVDVNKDGKDENVVFTCHPVGEGDPVFYDVFAQKMYDWTDMINTQAGAYVSLQDVHPSNDGSNRIFVGAYLSDNCAVYNIKSQDYANYMTAGQTDSQIMYKGVLYAGNYSTCTLTEVDATGGAPQELYTLSSYGQKRIHCLAAGEDKIFFSTVPGTYNLGGYLAWYDLKNGDKYAAKLSDLNAALEDQVVLSMAYADGYLYCGTTVRGGSDSTPTRTTSHFFVLDVASKKIVAIQEIAYPYVSSLDADSSGTVWGVISQTLFTVSYKNGSISFQQKFSRDSGKLTDSEREAAGISSSAWFNKPIFFRNDYLYVGLGDSGLWKISKSGTATRISSKITGRLYALGEDGNVYYGSGKNLMFLPLSVSSSDKNAAAAVNAELDSLLRADASSNGSALAAAKDAYAKLTNVQKSLVDVAKMNAANRRYLMALIDTLPETVTVSAAGAIVEARDAYNAMSTTQRSRITNYARLVAAENELSGIMDKNAVEQLIQTLNKEIFLTSENEVRAVRAMYEALTEEQKAQISEDMLAILTNAEAELESLKNDVTEAEAVLSMDVNIESQTLASGASVQTTIAGAVDSKYTLYIDFANGAAWTCEVWLDDELVDTLNVSAAECSFALGMKLNGNHTLMLKNVSDSAVAFNAEKLNLIAYVDAASALSIIDSDARVITLQHNATVPEFALINGDVLNLNGNVLTVGGNGAIVVNGEIIDSATVNADLAKEELGGIEGQLAITAGSSNYLPLKDGNIYRFYYYEARVFDSAENPYRSGEYLLFWFDVEFNHASVYSLIESGASGLSVSAELTWTTADGNGNIDVCFDEIVTSWASDQEYSMCVVVTGWDELSKGDVITVTPVLESAGMRAQVGESMTYVSIGRLTVVAFHGVFGSGLEQIFFNEEE